MAIAFAVLCAAGQAVAAPYRPASDGEILERLPAPLAAGRARLRALQSGGPAADLEGALALADFYIAAGRDEADPRLYSYAEGALRRWIDADDPPAPVVLRRAQIRQFRHDFDGALDDLDTLVADGYDDPQVWLLKASVLRVRGRYGAAMDACARLVPYRDRLVAMTCAAEVQSLGGDSRAALDNLSRAMEAPTDMARPADVQAWSELVLAGIAERQGAPAVAERWYRSALARAPGGAYGLGAYADFLMAQGRPAEAARLLGPHQKVDGLLLRLALAEAQSAPGGGQRLVPVLQARFEAVRARGDRPHLSDEALFELVLKRRPQVAYRHALENWRLLREPRDARVLAQTALATGDRQSARTALRQLAGHDINDRSLATLRRRLEERVAGSAPAGV